MKDQIKCVFYQCLIQNQKLNLFLDNTTDYVVRSSGVERLLGPTGFDSRSTRVPAVRTRVFVSRLCEDCIDATLSLVNNLVNIITAKYSFHLLSSRIFEIFLSSN